jgi:hypothetical protein
LALPRGVPSLADWEKGWDAKIADTRNLKPGVVQPIVKNEHALPAASDFLVAPARN